MHYLSVDLEDWNTSAYLRHYVNKGNYVSRIEFSTEKILELFARKKVKATFFTLGCIAESNPDLIKTIYEEGHEIASHGYSHTPLWLLTKEAFGNEIKQTNQVLESITGSPVWGYRAPYASLDFSTAWAIEVLREFGFIYDSSVFPMKTPLYGINGVPLGSYAISEKNLIGAPTDESLLEIPFSVYKQGYLKIPCTGGIYGRFLPERLLLAMLGGIAKKRPINFYFHPWEIDSNIPRLNVPFYNKIVSYYNVAGYLDKIENVLDCFEFDSFSSILQANNINSNLYGKRAQVGGGDSSLQ